jgi:hypothetical protein
LSCHSGSASRSSSATCRRAPRYNERTAQVTRSRLSSTRSITGRTARRGSARSAATPPGDLGRQHRYDHDLPLEQQLRQCAARRQDHTTAADRHKLLRRRAGSHYRVRFGSKHHRTIEPRLEQQRAGAFQHAAGRPLCGSRSTRARVEWASEPGALTQWHAHTRAPARLRLCLAVAQSIDRVITDVEYLAYLHNSLLKHSADSTSHTT